MRSRAITWTVSPGATSTTISPPDVPTRRVPPGWTVKDFSTMRSILAGAAGTATAATAVKSREENSVFMGYIPITRWKWIKLRTNLAAVPKSFSALTEQEILALAVTLEEDDGRILGDFAERLRSDYPESALTLSKMQEEESEHRHRLITAYRERFGDYIPLIRREDVSGFVKRLPVWQMKTLSVSQVRRAIDTMENETRRFYEEAARRSHDAGIRQLLGDLAAEEVQHSDLAQKLEADHRSSGAPEREDKTRRRSFVLQVVQPGLAGLMDGSVSTLAPLFAAAFATHSSSDALKVGLAASIGAGISMGFAEAMSDDGVLSGRGKPLLRGVVCGAMTTVGGLGHTLPYIIQDFRTATAVAGVVVAVELAVIAWIRKHFMDTPLLSAVFQVVLGGILVFLTGILIGSS
jgi:rubrerythrin